jgi:hypothetical protein
MFEVHQRILPERRDLASLSLSGCEIESAPASSSYAVARGAATFFSNLRAGK